MAEYSSQGFGPNDLTPAGLRLSQDSPLVAALAESYYSGLGADIVSATGAPTITHLQFVPFWSGAGGVIDRIAFNVTTGGGAGSKARAGLYAAHQGTMLPTDLIVDGGEYDTTTNTFKTTTLSPTIVLPPGHLFYLAFACGTAAPTVTTLSSGWHVFGRANGLGAVGSVVRTGFTYGPLPTQAPVPNGNIAPGTTAMVCVRFATYNRPGNYGTN